MTDQGSHEEIDDKGDKDDQGEKDKSPGAELREGLMHLFSAARKVMKTAEPAVQRSLDDAERVIGKIGRGGEVVANEVGKEVATLATKLADKLRQVANRDEHGAPDEPAAQPPADDQGGHGDGGSGGN